MSKLAIAIARNVLICAGVGISTYAGAQEYPVPAPTPAVDVRTAQAGGFSQPGSAIATPAVRNYGWYGGLALGQSNAKGACDGIPVSCDKTDTGWKFFGGYQFNPNLGLELGYIDFGKAKASGVVNGVAVSGEAKAQALELMAIGNLPLGAGVSIYAKGGIFRWDGDIDVSAQAPGFRAVGSTSDSGTEFSYGAGLRYDFNLRYAARLEWQRYLDIGNAATIKSDVDFYNVALIYKF